MFGQNQFAFKPKNYQCSLGQKGEMTTYYICELELRHVHTVSVDKFTPWTWANEKARYDNTKASAVFQPEARNSLSDTIQLIVR